MALAFRYVAPAGAPIGAADVLRWSARGLSHGSSVTALERELGERLGVPHVSLTSTGRAGFTLLLRAMRRLAGPARTEVVVPAYTCYSVAASVVKAGLVPLIVDIEPDTLDFAPDALARTDFSRALAIVGTNLYGLPSDMAALRALADRHRLFLIDDAAQAMGARVQGRWSGTWGDAGLLSFDKGKNVSAIDGGAVLVHDARLNEALRTEMQELGRPGLGTSASHVVKALAYAVLLRPWLYWIPARTPQLGLGRTVFMTDYPLALPDRLLVALALTQMRHLEEFTAARVRNAAALVAGLKDLPGVRLVTLLPAADPVYLRLPVLFDTPEARDATMAALNAAGIGATGSYPASLGDLPELDAFVSGAFTPGARRVARTILTLPTHPFVSTADVARTLRVLRDTLATHTATPHVHALAQP